MKNRYLGYLLIMLAMFTLVTQSASAQGDANNGAQVFKNNCAACHGDQMEGGIGPALNREEITNSEENVLIETVTNGRETGGMPSFRDQLSEQEIQDAVALLKNPSALASLGGGGLTIVEPEISTEDILPNLMKSFLFVFLWTGVALIALLVWIKNKK